MDGNYDGHINEEDDNLDRLQLESSKRAISRRDVHKPKSRSAMRPTEMNCSCRRPSPMVGNASNTTTKGPQESVKERNKAHRFEDRLEDQLSCALARR